VTTKRVVGSHGATPKSKLRSTYPAGSVAISRLVFTDGAMWRLLVQRESRANRSRSPQQLVNDGFDVNDGCIEKLDARTVRVAQ
jgi:hypothetical protein